jgi:hypothetical protein
VRLLPRLIDPVGEEIVEEIAGMLAILDETKGGTEAIAARIYRDLLFSAGLILYRRLTENMGTDAAISFVNRRTDRMVEKWRAVAT